MTGHSRSHGIVTLLDSNHCPRTATLFDLTTKPQICVVKKSWNMHCQLERPAVGCGPSFLPSLLQYLCAQAAQHQASSWHVNRGPWPLSIRSKVCASAPLPLVYLLLLILLYQIHQEWDRPRRPSSPSLRLAPLVFDESFHAEQQADSGFSQE